MWWRRKRVQESDDTLRTLSGRIDEMESSLRRVKVEWEDVLDRMERVMGRLNKRSQREAVSPPANSTDTEAHSERSTVDMVQLRRSGRGGPRGIG